MAASSVAGSFLDELDWLQCTFCAQEFTRKTTFFFLSCNKVACSGCARRMKNGMKIDCNICKRTVSVCPIRDDMPANIRKKFSNIENLFDEVVRIADFQLDLHQQAIQYQRERLNNVKEREAEVRAGNQQHMQELEKVMDMTKKYREQILKVIPEDQMNALLELDETELNEMDIMQVIGPLRSGSSTSSRRRSIDSSPMDMQHFGDASSSHLSNASTSNVANLRDMDRHGSPNIQGHSFGNDAGVNQHRRRSTSRDTSTPAIVPGKIGPRNRSRESRRSGYYRRSRECRKSRESHQ
ncbi:uncharacterized protein LOC116341236 [Contarinia nasturtii]|uniref:uncharacterized protein LOC116341236 n=1 Tax=Contarinia nasturtii TaxID=265458 RepID=UPI0012D42495|nr:uncharacterized protein LOC116341236 [Contarinia nasturtii]